MMVIAGHQLVKELCRRFRPINAVNQMKCSLTKTVINKLNSTITPARNLNPLCSDICVSFNCEWIPFQDPLMNDIARLVPEDKITVVNGRQAQLLA